MSFEQMSAPGKSGGVTAKARSALRDPRRKQGDPGEGCCANPGMRNGGLDQEATTGRTGSGGTVNGSEEEAGRVCRQTNVGVSRRVRGLGLNVNEEAAAFSHMGTEGGRGREGASRGVSLLTPRGRQENERTEWWCPRPLQGHKLSRVGWRLTARLDEEQGPRAGRRMSGAGLRGSGRPSACGDSAWVMAPGWPAGHGEAPGRTPRPPRR